MTASCSSLPIPGREKTISANSAPDNIVPMPSPRMVTVGSMAMRKA
jgi:hypothetical protein